MMKEAQPIVTRTVRGEDGKLQIISRSMTVLDLMTLNTGKSRTVECGQGFHVCLGCATNTGRDGEE